MSKFTQSELRRALDTVLGNSNLMSPYEEALDIVIEAASQHADTMPKEIDVWDVEYAYKTAGVWYPTIARCNEEGAAISLADNARNHPEVREVKITKRTTEMPNE